MYEICSKLTIKTPERRRLRILLVFPLLTLSKQMSAGSGLTVISFEVKGFKDVDAHRYLSCTGLNLHLEPQKHFRKI